MHSVQIHRLADNRLYRLASQYTADELAEIYNQARVDYIVPMPMNGQRMAEYIVQYDVDLSASAVSLNDDDPPLATGVNMIGLRGDRSWVTRLGVIPERRGHKVGQSLMELSIQNSKERNVRRAQLEVIKGNIPAYKLFLKLGFVEVRELLVIRRPPGSPDKALDLPGSTMTIIDGGAIPSLLVHRDPDVAWTEETSSLLHAGRLRGLQMQLPSGESGWVVYQFMPFQLTHVVLKPGVSSEMAQTLLYHVHKQHPMHDTKVENLPRAHPAWPAFQKLGYLETFSRIEMFLTL